MTNALEAVRSELEARVAARQSAAQRCRRHELLLSYVRLGVFLSGAVLLWPVLMTRTLHAAWLAVPCGLFLVVARVHERVISRRQRLERAVRFHEDALARMDDRWPGRGTTGDAFLDAGHPYSADLDLFGKGSVYELLCVARTRVGQSTLASWLRAPARPDEVRRRQDAVRELAGRLDLREDLAVAGDEVAADDDPEALLRWATSPAVLVRRWPLVLAVALSLLSCCAAVAWWLTPVGRPLFLASLMASAAFGLWLRQRVESVLGGADRPERELRLLSGVLARLEREMFRAPLLVDLRGALESGGEAPSRRIAHLARLLELRDSRRNMIFAPIAAVMFLGTHLAYALERWRAASGGDLRRWLEALGATEALASMAALAHERPGEAFPEIVDQGVLFDAEAVGHPLLPDARCVRNDLCLDDRRRLLVVSGSNMSGKSTLLRTVGVNAVLALAGAPVRARRLRVSALAVGACMRVQDSLQAGTSHFYAEITRLSSLLRLADRGEPLLFLFDEVLHGTNSHDRRIGAEGLMRALLARGASGLVTTHDLALSRIAEALAPVAANVHFEDRIEAGRMVFDYRLRQGVVERSNALELMRAVGLEV